MLHIGDVPETPDRAHALEDGAAGDEPGLAVVDDQGLVHVARQLLLHGWRTVGQNRAQWRVILGASLSIYLKVDHLENEHKNLFSYSH